MVDLSAIQRVAVVDDDPMTAALMAELVRDAGYEAIELAPDFRSLERLVSAVRSTADAAVCDHRLRRMQLAHFDGAEAVATLYEHQVPALLVTQYVDTDSDISIRLWRYHVPVVMRRQDVDHPVRIREGLEDCAREISGDFAPERRPWRALIEVYDLAEDGEQAVVEAYVFQWKPDELVRFPVALVPDQLRANLAPGSFLIAKVNIGADASNDLFFADFEAAPDPLPEDRLG